MTGPSREQLAIVQGAYFLTTGVWPLVHLPSFEAVTGPKTDTWLVRTVGILIGVAGGVMLAAGAARRVTPEVRGLAVGSALGLGAIDVVYTLRGRISPIYLADALVEASVVGAWVAGEMARNGSRPRSGCSGSRR